MIDTTTLLTYAAVVLGLFLIPGPAVLLVLARSVTGARAPASPPGSASRSAISSTPRWRRSACQPCL